MKLKIILLMVCTVLCLSFASCGRDYNNADESTKSICGDYFVQIKEWSEFTIVYAKDTKVKYLIWDSGYRVGITPLYNANGSLQVYEEGK